MGATIEGYMMVPYTMIALGRRIRVLVQQGTVELGPVKVCAPERRMEVVLMSKIYRCPNWFVCECNYSKGGCRHKKPHPLQEGENVFSFDVSCHRKVHPCDEYRRYSWVCRNYTDKHDCPKWKGGGCIEIGEEDNDGQE